MAAEHVSEFGNRALRRATSRLRVAPTFIVIGGIRCGTTSLITYLSDHPDTRAIPTRELHYFDWNFDRGDGWYRAFFPIRSATSKPAVSGESSPAYLMDPVVPPRAAAGLPNVKLILLLRNPVQRAYSHYHLRHGKGMDPAPAFESALDDEERRLAENAKIGGRRASNLDCYFYQGRYVDGLNRWLAHFDKSRFLILRSEDLYQDTAGLYSKVLDFLELPPHDLGRYEVHNAAKYDVIDPATRAALVNRYAPLNTSLYEVIGQDLGWQ